MRLCCWWWPLRWPGGKSLTACPPLPLQRCPSRPHCRQDPRTTPQKPLRLQGCRRNCCRPMAISVLTHSLYPPRRVKRTQGPGCQRNAGPSLCWPAPSASCVAGTAVCKNFPTPIRCKVVMAIFIWCTRGTVRVSSMSGLIPCNPFQSHRR